MQITKENLSVYAAKHYDNPFCLTEDEFKSDLFKISVIRKLISAYYSEKGNDNLKLIVNTTIGFFNVFEHHAATKMLEYRLLPEQHETMNAILLYLNLPLVGNKDKFDSDILQKLIREYGR
jgi:hypothetical protein